MFIGCAKDFLVDTKNFGLEAATYSIPQAAQIAAIVAVGVNVETFYKSACDGMIVATLTKGIAHGSFLHPVFWFWFSLIFIVCTL